MTDDYDFSRSYDPNAKPDLSDVRKWGQHWVDRARYDIAHSNHLSPVMKDMCRDLTVVAEYAMRFEDTTMYEFAMERVQHYLKGENENGKTLD